MADEASRRTAVGTARTAIVTGFLGLGALLGLVINNTSARAAVASAEAAVANSRVASETLRVTGRGHLTDRYAKAVEQLGDDKLAVRLGGNISGARLAGGNLGGVRMNTVGINSADLSNINLDGANFNNASLLHCDLTNAKLRKTIFRTGSLSHSKLHDADLEGATSVP